MPRFSDIKKKLGEFKDEITALTDKGQETMDRLSPKQEITQEDEISYKNSPRNLAVQALGLPESFRMSEADSKRWDNESSERIADSAMGMGSIGKIAKPLAIKGLTSAASEMSQLGNVAFPAKSAAEAMKVAEAMKNPELLKKVLGAERAAELSLKPGASLTIGAKQSPLMKESLESAGNTLQSARIPKDQLLELAAEFPSIYNKIPIKATKEAMSPNPEFTAKELESVRRQFGNLIKK